MPTIQELLGAGYKEGMTLDEINEAIKDKKIVDLSTGEYVGKGKYDAAVKERDDARKERDEIIASHKDYDELKKYRETSEAEKASKALTDKLTSYGAKAEMVDFVKFQIESGKIERGKDDKTLEENVKKFLKENPQYASSEKPTPPANTNHNPPRVNIGGNDNGGANPGEKTLPKKVKSQPWNRH